MPEPSGCEASQLEAIAARYAVETLATVRLLGEADLIGEVAVGLGTRSDSAPWLEATTATAIRPTDTHIMATRPTDTAAHIQADTVIPAEWAHPNLPGPRPRRQQQRVLACVEFISTGRTANVTTLGQSSQ